VDPAYDSFGSRSEEKTRLAVKAVKKLVNRKVGSSMAVVFVRPYNCGTPCNFSGNCCIDASF